MYQLTLEGDNLQQNHSSFQIGKTMPNQTKGETALQDSLANIKENQSLVIQNTNNSLKVSFLQFQASQQEDSLYIYNLYYSSSWFSRYRYFDDIFKKQYKQNSHLSDQRKNQNQSVQCVFRSCKTQFFISSLPRWLARYYYISKDGDPSKVLLFFQGGGWCSSIDYQKTIEQCYSRSTYSMGSSKSIKQSLVQNQGIFSTNQNNYFKNWKKVHINYCDGMGHQGYRKQPIQYKGNMLYFRGYNLTAQKLQSLEEKIGLFSNATQIVVSGQSAGGIASLQWTNYIADRAKKARVFGMPFSAIFYNASFLQQPNSFYYNQMIKNMVNITNSQADPPNAECAKQNPNNKQRCHFVQHLYKYIKVPVFVVQSLYDTADISFVKGLYCTDFSLYTLSFCNNDQLFKIQQHRKQIFDLLKQMGSINNNGIWGVACPGHMFFISDRFYSLNYTVPSFTSNTMNKAIKGWLDNSTQKHVYLDNTCWPQNFYCSGLN